MFFILLFLFTVVPLLEFWLLMQISQHTSFLFTIALIIFTGVIGAALAKHQGLENWRKFQTGMANGQPPTDTLLDGLLIMIAGAVLIAPGIMTDIFGFLLLIPPVRSVIKKVLKEVARKRTVVHFQNMSNFQGTGFSETSSREHSDHESDHKQVNENIIDVDFTSETIED